MSPDSLAMSAARVVPVLAVAFLKKHLGNSRFFTLGPLQPNYRSYFYRSYFGIGSLNVDDIPIPEAFSTYVHARLDSVVQPHVFVGTYGGGAASYFTATNPNCRTTAKGRQSVRLSCPGPTVLVRRETDLPGWSVRVDGDPSRLHRFDHLFQAVNIEPGKHQVTFSYSQPHVRWGFVAFAAGCLWLLLAPIATRRSAAPASEGTSGSSSLGTVATAPEPEGPGSARPEGRCSEPTHHD
jgi:Bacterial membrane protein YfhO